MVVVGVAFVVAVVSGSEVAVEPLKASPVVVVVGGGSFPPAKS
jgi:hypothetical protein